MTVYELINRLREATGWKNASEHYSLMKEAADALEELQGKHFLRSSNQYIERDKVMDALLHEQYGYLCEEAIRSIPAADVRPVVRGRWKLNKDGSGVCSVCGRTQLNCWDDDNQDNYCHYCGADLREES